MSPWSAGCPDDSSRLQTFRTLFEFKLNRLTLGEGAKAFVLNLRIVHKNVPTCVLFYESVPFGFVEPLDFAYRTQ